MLKSSVGVYGMLAVCGICLRPFLRIGIQYLLLKLAVALGSLMGKSGGTGLLEKLTDAMSLILSATGVGCILTLLILTLCVHTVRV